MKRSIFSTLAAIISMASAVPAFAASTETVRSGGVFLLIFLGFCAFVVVAQLIPAIITLWGMIRGVAEKKKTVETPE